MDEKKRYKLRKLRIGQLATIMVSLVGLYLGGTHTVSAEQKSIFYHSVNYTDLSASQQNQIIYAKPSGSLQENEEILLVYRLKTSPTSNLSHSLPQTGEVSSYLLTGVGIATVIAVVTALRSKRGRIFLVSLVASGSLLGSYEISAQDLHQLAEVVQQLVEENTSFSYSPQEISGYDYIGYIRQGSGQFSPEKPTSHNSFENKNSSATVSQEIDKENKGPQSLVERQHEILVPSAQTKESVPTESEGIRISGQDKTTETPKVEVPKSTENKDGNATIEKVPVAPVEKPADKPATDGVATTTDKTVIKEDKTPSTDNSVVPSDKPSTNGGTSTNQGATTIVTPAVPSTPEVKDDKGQVVTPATPSLEVPVTPDKGTEDKTKDVETPETPKDNTVITPETPVVPGKTAKDEVVSPDQSKDNQQNSSENNNQPETPKQEDNSSNTGNDNSATDDKKSEDKSSNVGKEDTKPSEAPATPEVPKDENKQPEAPVVETKTRQIRKNKTSLPEKVIEDSTILKGAPDVVETEAQEGYDLVEESFQVNEDGTETIASEKTVETVVPVMASSQFFSKRKMKKPPAMLVANKASSFHLFFHVSSNCSG